jgi:NAD(P)-dependent dehydrogenase (short-subunit alcohol dehydrogenase family)
MKARGVCLVTGAASGIGLAAARELSRQGWRVALLDRDGDALSSASNDLGRAARTAQLDVADAPSVENALAAIERDFGPVEGVVNSAGIARDCPGLDTDPAVFRAILDVNVIGSFVVAQAAARIMVGAKRPGAIVNLASVSGNRGSIGRVAYGASKAAVISMTKVMAVEWACHGIRVNAVSPGPVETRLTKALHGPKIREQWLRAVPLRRYAAPEEIASAIAFLLDEEKASYITGHVLAVDGGFDAGGLLPEA